MSRVDAARATFRAALVANADFFYPVAGYWSDGTASHFKVGDPNAGKQALQTVLSLERASLRRVKFEPGQPVPALGSHLAWEGGQLYLGPATDPPNLTGIPTYTARQVDARYYPQPVTLPDASVWLARIEALDSLPGSTPSGTQDLSQTPNNSHRLTLPPGVFLNPGDHLQTSNGDRYLVVTPVERHQLGDVLGLSWQGPEQVGLDPTPDQPGDPDPLPPSDDSWWHQP